MSLDIYKNSSVIIPSMIEDVPVELKSSTLRKPVASGFSSRSFACQNSSVGPGGQAFFQIPVGHYAIKPDTAYLRFNISVDGAAADTWQFQGQSQSASALINQLMVQVNGQTVDLRQNYDAVMDLLTIHTANSNYVNSELAILQGSSTNGTVANAFQTSTAAAGAKNYDFVVPLKSTVFSSQNAWPHYLLKDNMMVILNTNALNRAIWGSANTISNYTLTSMYICFDTIDLDQAFVEGVKASMRAGQMYSINDIQYISTLVGGNTSTTNIYNMGVNASSVSSVLWTYIQNLNGGTNQSNYYNSGVNSSSDFRVLLDGRLVASEPINSLPVQYKHTLDALGTYMSVDSNFAKYDSANSALATRTNYATKGFLGGLSTRRFNPHACSMGGLSANNVQIQLIVSTAPQATDNLMYVITYDVLLVIDADGNVTRMS